MSPTSDHDAAWAYQRMTPEAVALQRDEVARLRAEIKKLRREMLVLSAEVMGLRKLLVKP